MSYTHTPIPAGTRTVSNLFWGRGGFEVDVILQRSVRLNARLYSCTRRAPCSTKIVTEVAGPHRYPALVGALGGSSPGIIRAAVFTVNHNGVDHRFVFFFRNYCRLPFNRNIIGRIWRGNVVVMRVSAFGDGVVGLRSTDRWMVDLAVRQFVVSFLHLGYLLTLKYLGSFAVSLLVVIGGLSFPETRHFFCSHYNFFFQQYFFEQWCLFILALTFPFGRTLFFG